MHTRHLLVHGFLFSLAAPALSQNILFQEGFDAGIPATWTNRHLGFPHDPWAAGTSPATNSPDVFHEFFCTNGFILRINQLVTPRIDLSGFTRADFSCAQHQSFPLSRMLNMVEVSVDGGNVFTPIYTETGTWSGPGAIAVNLDSFAGRPDVRIAFHYQGQIANEWRIDDVRVTTPQPVYSIAGLTAGGTATFAVRGAPPGALVLMGLSLTGPGPVPTPFGMLHMSPPIGVLPWQFADAAGAAAMPVPIPTGTTGVAVDAQAGVLHASGVVELSNFIATRVQ